MNYFINLFFTSAHCLAARARLLHEFSLVLDFFGNSGYIQCLRPGDFGRSDDTRKHIQFNVKDT